MMLKVAVCVLVCQLMVVHACFEQSAAPVAPVSPLVPPPAAAPNPLPPVSDGDTPLNSDCASSYLNKIIQQGFDNPGTGDLLVLVRALQTNAQAQLGGDYEAVCSRSRDFAWRNWHGTKSCKSTRGDTYCIVWNN